MGIFKEVKNTVKNIFNADDDMLFEDDVNFDDKKEDGGFPKFSFGKKKDIKENMPLPNFDVSNHSFSVSQNKQYNNKSKSNGRIQVYVPKSFEEAFNIIRDVKQGFTAMVNVEVANPQISQRIIDLISGAMYALDGDCKKMGEKQYIFSLSAETVGAYDYLPINGASNNNSGYNFNMGNTPFNFMNQQQMQQPIPQGFAQYNPQQFPTTQQVQFPNQQIEQNQMPQQGFAKPDFNSFHVPPQSQF